MTDDPYAKWRYRIANPKEKVTLTTEPEPGFYKRRMFKNGPWIPVWIYPRPLDGSRWSALREGKEYHADAEWLSCMGKPITQDVYEAVAERGEEWPDADPTIAAQRRQASDDRDRPDSNEPPDIAETLKDQIESAKQSAGKYGKFERWTKRGKTNVPVVTSFIKTDADAEKAQEVRSRLLELYRDGDREFHVEKDPITKRGREIDERWRFREEAEEVAAVLRESIGVYQTEKLRQQRTAEEANRRAAESIQQQQDREISFIAAAPEPVATPAPVVPLETTVKGSSGRAATVTAVEEVTEITDVDALFAWQPIHDHKEMKPFLLALAQRAYAAGHRDIPGVTVGERVSVR